VGEKRRHSRAFLDGLGWPVSYDGISVKVDRSQRKKTSSIVRIVAKVVPRSEASSRTCQGQSLSRYDGKKSIRMTGTTNGTMTPSWVSLVISTLLILLACLPACATVNTKSVSGEEVSVGRHMTVTLPVGSSLKVSASSAAMSVARSVTAHVKTPGGLEPSPLELLSTPMLLHSSGTLPRGRIMLSVVITPPTSPGSEPFLARYDPVTATWFPVVSHYDPITQTVSGEIAHFSVWAALCFATTGIKAVVQGTLQPLVGSIKINSTVPNCTTSSGVSAYIVPSN